MTRLLPCAALVAALLPAASVAPPSSAPASDAPPAPIGEKHSVAYPGRAMGTTFNVVLPTADSVAMAPVAYAAHAEFHRIDSLMSNWTATSEVARLNREADGRTTTVDAEVASVLDEAMRTWRDSDGAFDVTVEPLVRAWGFLGGRPRVPSDSEQTAAFRRVGARRLEFDAARRTLRFRDAGVRIDLGGIAKGYAVDAATRALSARGVTDALVDISGNMFALGSPGGGRSWTIGIRDPRDRIPYFARLPVTRAVSTSGKYEQFVAAGGRTYGHIMDPRTGHPADGLIAVTVLAPTATLADAWSTALFVLGLDAARRKARERDDLDAVLVAPGNGGVDTVWVERSLEGRLRLEPGASRMFHVAYY